MTRGVARSGDSADRPDWTSAYEGPPDWAGSTGSGIAERGPAEDDFAGPGATGRGVAGPGLLVSEVDEAHLDDLINERSAASAEELEEQERARVAALRTAPTRMLGAAGLSARRVAAGAVGVGRRGVRLIAFSASAVAAGAASVAGAGRRAMNARSDRRQELSGSRYRNVAMPRSPGRRIGLAAVIAVAIAAPAAGTPAPWVALVGASVDDSGPRVLANGLPADLFGPHALGPLPNELPARGLAGSGTSTGIGTAANPTAAGLPVGGSDHSIPSTVLLAYQRAADRLAVEDSGCHLSWTLIAGIGRVESNHARSWGGNSRLTAAGVATPAILGPVLDGSLPGTSRVFDTDGGRLDGNPNFDRAVGPMQFVPGTWKLLGRDGNGDGVADPNNIWDAALSTATYLCHVGGDLSQPAAQAAAVFAYNPSADYVRTVLAWSRAYATGATVDLGLPIGGFALPPSLTVGLPPGNSNGRGGTTSDAGTGFDLQVGAAPTLGLSTGSGSGGSGGSHPRTPTPQPAGPKPQTATTRTTAPQPSTPQPTQPSAGNGGGKTTPPPTTTPKPPPAFALSSTSLADARVGNDVRFTVQVTATATGSALLRLRLADSAGLRVTGSGQVVTFEKAGTKTVTFDVDGGFIGDSGVDGPYTASLTGQPTDPDGRPSQDSTSTALGGTHQTAKYQAADFPDYLPSVQRIRERVNEFVDRGLVTAGAKKTLQADLVGSKPDLQTFRDDLKALHKDGSVGLEAFVRLDSLADRRQNPPAGATASQPKPGQPAPPGPDPEVLAGRDVE